MAGELPIIAFTHELSLLSPEAFAEQVLVGKAGAVHVVVGENYRFGHAAAAPAVHGTLKLLDDAGIAAELALREVRSGRTEVTQMWGRPESIRQEQRALRAQ